MGDKYLSEVITADDIKNSKENAICIVSGVGSGKNYFVENVLYEECGKSILYITSRRAKADEILKDTDAVRKIDWNKADSMVTLTNSGVQYLLASRTEQYPVKDMINHFDYFVLDEAHSIATDATFTLNFPAVSLSSSFGMICPRHSVLKLLCIRLRSFVVLVR